MGMAFLKDKQVKNAIFLGVLCFASYLGVYIVRNILGAVTPQMIGVNGLTTEYIGEVSSLYFTAYAIGQLVNGVAGDKIKARYMLGLGLISAGMCNLVFPNVISNVLVAKIVYSISGFFLSMIYAPMTKLIAENTKPLHAVRCSMGYTFASLLGSPIAGIISTFLAWEQVFRVGGFIICIMGTICLIILGYMEKVGIIRYNRYEKSQTKKQKKDIRILVKHQIIKFTIVSILTGVIRTTVIFWLPTYLTQYLGFSAEQSATLFSVITLNKSFNTFIAIFVYERLLKRNMNMSLLLFFVLSSICFLGVYIIQSSILNMLLILLGIMGAGMASTMLWSIYCPSLRDTGMTSSATGFLDFVSYMAAAGASTLFANAVAKIGWKNLILIWFGLMMIGVVIALPLNRIKLSMKVRKNNGN